MPAQKTRLLLSEVKATEDVTDSKLALSSASDEWINNVLDLPPPLPANAYGCETRILPNAGVEHESEECEPFCFANDCDKLKKKSGLLEEKETIF